MRNDLIRVCSLIIALSVCASAAEAATYYVAKTGADSNPCVQAQTVTTPKLTITGALGCMTAAGDRVEVRTGFYDESVVTDSMPGIGTSANRMVIAKYQTDVPVIRPAGTKCYAIIFMPSRPYVTLDGINLDGIQGAGCGLSSGGALIATNDGFANGITVKNLDIKDSGGSNLLKGDGILIQSVTVHGTGWRAQQLGYAQGSNGLYLEGLTNSLVQDVTTYDNACFGLRVYESSGAEPQASNNIINRVYAYNNGPGKGLGGTSNTCSVQTTGGGFVIGDLNNIVMNAIAYNNAPYGFWVTAGGGTSSGNKLYNVTATANTIGIQVQGSPMATNTTLANVLSASNTSSNYVNGGTNTVVTTSRLTGVITDCTILATDWHLKTGTNPCVDIGTSLAVVTMDYASTPRPKGTAYDIGAYELDTGGGGGGSCTGVGSGSGDQRLNFPGGFVENQNAATRTKYTLAQINAIIPTTCGAFTWPAPYNTKTFRLTDASDCTGGTDCQWYVGYSYWNNMNAHTNDTTMLIVLGSATNRGGTGMNLYRLDKTTDAVTKLGPIFGSGVTSPTTGLVYRDLTGEGWYFSSNPSNPTMLYVNDGWLFRRYNVLTQAFTQTIFNAQTQFGADRTIMQLHTSADDTVHSMTLKVISTNAVLGCAVYNETTTTWRFYAKVGVFDECSLDKTGRWTILLEDHGTDAQDDSMRVCDNTTGTCVSVEEGLNNGTLGHMDTGYGYMVGADNDQALDHATIYWDFGPPLTKGPAIHSNFTAFTVDKLNHVAHSNARANIPRNQQMACGSNVDTTTVQNEVTCVRIDATAPLQQMIVAPLGNSLSATGGCCDSYAKEPKGNIDISGQYFLWSSNMGGTRLDHYLVKVPQSLLPTTLPPTFAPGMNLRRAP